ncbi:orotidine-5'-phosphate decarboxylase [Candidatus Parcubacteria bacterium]|nr:orotidine-5'-phosphate decarboxylase [Candidatus Parcubacteria bacterium]
MTGKIGFREKLARRQQEINSLVCVGLDPLVEKLPNIYVKRIDREYLNSAIELWLRDIVDATAPYASMFKPQKAHYEALKDGHYTLRFIVNYIHDKYPNIPVFLDCKRGDIGRTQQRYRIAHFEIDGVDGINFSPYMGSDCMEYLVDKGNNGRAIVGLCYTSNLAAREVQDIKLADGRHYWEFIADRTLNWAQKFEIVENAGLVMAAAHEYPKGSGKIFSFHLSRGREIVGDKLWYLIPGVGAQKGFVEETVKTAYVGPGSIAINSSSGIIFASQGDDFAEAAAYEAKKLRDQIRRAGGNA